MAKAILPDVGEAVELANGDGTKTTFYLRPLTARERIRIGAQPLESDEDLTRLLEIVECALVGWDDDFLGAKWDPKDQPGNVDQLPWEFFIALAEHVVEKSRAGAQVVGNSASPSPTP